MKALMIAGTHSGAGKTTVTLALLAALVRRGLRVQPFKVGPDYIDPLYHHQVAGRPSVQLDSWLLPERFIQESFANHAAGAEVAVIEGAMGLFDGVDGVREEGSSAHLAKMLSLPVLLVIDAYALSRSAGAMALGYEAYDPALSLAGVLFNRVASETHYHFLRTALEARAGAPPAGYLPFDPELAIPERHLGLTSALERPLERSLVDRLVKQVETHVDLDLLLARAAGVELHPPSPPERRARAARLGVARDKAFCFYYLDNFRLLEGAGGEIVFFSPLKDRELPEVDALYFGGGYPELFARELSGNRAMLRSVREFIERGRPVYAECGGLMYLVRRLAYEGGQSFRMVGAVPGSIRMTSRLQAVGYRECEVIEDTLLAPRGSILRGHEFHWSEWEEEPASGKVYRTGERLMGYGSGQLLASYLHLHFGFDPALAARLVERAASA